MNGLRKYNIKYNGNYSARKNEILIFAGKCSIKHLLKGN
jgi:hypothetical protein